MAHLVENMMYVGKPPWHGLGKALPQELTATEALPHAGLDWTVSLKPAYVCREPEPLGPSGLAPIPGCAAVVRDSDGFPLGVVGRKYVPIQNCDVASLADAIAGESQALCHTAGSLDHGRRIWFLLKLPDLIVVGKDASPIEKHLLLTTTHDGTGTYRVLFTPVRVVCANTLNMALVGNEGLCIRHTQGAQAQVEAAKAAMRGVVDFYSRFDLLAQALASAPYTDELMEELAAELYPAPKKEDEASAALHPVTQRNREKLSELFVAGEGHDTIRGTAWAALNAVVEYVDHWRPGRASDGSTVEENRVRSIWFGTGAELKARALEKISLQTGLSLPA